MATDHTEADVTPAARRLVDELVDDYRLQLLSAAESSAAQIGGQVREVSVHDVVAALRALKSTGHRERSRTERLLTLYTVAGAAVAVGGFAYWAFDYAVSVTSLQAQLPILIGVSGLLLFAVSFLTLRLRTLRMQGSGYALTSASSDELLRGRFLHVWRDIEIALRSLAAHEVGESVADAPLGVLFDLAARGRLLSATDLTRLPKLIDLRNAVAHSSRPVPVDQLQRAISEALLLRDALGTAVRRRAT